MMPDIGFSFGPEETGIVQTLVDAFNQQHSPIASPKWNRTSSSMCR
jgi:hypothetical protein